MKIYESQFYFKSWIKNSCFVDRACSGTVTEGLPCWSSFKSGKWFLHKRGHAATQSRNNAVNSRTLFHGTTQGMLTTYTFLNTAADGVNKYNGPKIHCLDMLKRNFKLSSVTS